MPGEQGVIPMISYEDGMAAIEWLTRAFGFRELNHITDRDGRLTHAELETGSGIVMLASPTPDYRGPNRHREECEIARRWYEVPWVIDGVLVYVDDVDEHHRRASLEGAAILSQPEGDEDGRRYRAEDIEGHRWMFMQRQGSA